MPGNNKPTPLSDFGADEATEELPLDTRSLPQVLPDFDDDPETESIEQGTQVVLPARYQVLRSLDSSEDQERYEVADTELGRVVVLEVAASPRCEAFRSWVTQRSLLTQPGVLQVYEVGELEDGRSYLTHGLPEGLTLPEWSRSALGAGVLLAVVDAARILGAAHARGMAHGAVTAERLRVLPSGQVVVVGWQQGAPIEDVRALASVLRELFKGRLAPRLAIVLQRVDGGRHYSDGIVFADALVEVLKIKIR